MMRTVKIPGNSLVSCKDALKEAIEILADHDICPEGMDYDNCPSINGHFPCKDCWKEALGVKEA